MSQATQTQHCGRCGATLGGYAPDGLCAACLVESAFEEAGARSSANPISPPLLTFRDYEVLDELARGGMGVVYRARQISLNRLVAVKMALGGQLAGVAEKQRFRAEAETAAQLQHPHIVAIHEVGEHAGQPFFSMDLVQGQNLAQLVRDDPLPSRKAAEYLKTIAEAVQYAHSRGVLHRDLKPSNVLIDDSGQPRITDFGLAKRLSSAQTSAVDPQLTRTGEVLGSPSFIPPEQATGRVRAVGPASDVYSLGAILYYCLTARPPFTAETITATLRMVEENEPVSPRLLNASVPRDLETICLKCLEKDPRRRYATAQDLADDVGRFLRNEPIRARPVSIVGKVHRWCLRNKALAVAGTTIFALFLVVAIGSPIAALHIQRERRQAEENEKKSYVITKFLSGILEGAGPLVAQGRDPALLKEILDKAAKRVGNEFTNQPEAEADVRLIIGKTYIDIGAFSNALAMTQEALRLRRERFGPKHIAVAEALNNLGPIYDELGDLSAAESYDRQALDLKKELLGDQDLNVALSMSNLGFRLCKKGDLAGAEPLHREALRIRRLRLDAGHPDIGASLNNLGMVLWSRGRFEEAESMFREALGVFQKAFGPDHRHVATMLNNLSEVLRQLGQLREAEKMNREALAMRQKHLGPRHSETVYTQNNLAGILESQGRFDEAAGLHREALVLFEESLGTNHPYVAEALSGLGVAMVGQGDLPGAESTQRAALATAERALGTNNPGTAGSLEHLAMLVAVRGDLPTAADMLTNVLSILRKAVGVEHPDLVPPLYHLSWVVGKQGDSAGAESLRGMATTLTIKGGAYGTRALVDSCFELAGILQAHSRYVEAEQLLLDLSKALESQSGGNPLLRCILCDRLIRLYETWGKVEPNTGKGAEAAVWRTKLSELSTQGGL